MFMFMKKKHKNNFIIHLNKKNYQSTFCYYFILLFFISCGSTKEYENYSTNLLPLQYWFQKDYQQDAVPGISLDKFYTQNTKKSKSKSIIVAVIDTQIDIHHEDLKGQLWINTKEIPNNGIDDDHNGYVDDVNGWNFLGTPNGGYVVWANFEYTRLVRDWAPLFKNKTESQIAIQDISHYKEYRKALKKLEEENRYYKNWMKSVSHSESIYPLIKDTLKYFFP
jgi:cell wall-associated protease